MTKPIFGVIADDLTGGMETAAMLIAQGIDCAFVTDPELVAHAGDVLAIVVAQKTRVISAEAAVAKSEAAARALLAKGTSQLFFKYCATFDSTDQGNIGPVADMLMSLTGARYTAFCPGSPGLSRTVYNGHLFLGTQLISESPKRHDPLTPMTDPDLVRVLQRQTSRKVGLLAHMQISSGEDAARQTIADAAERGTEYFIADSITDADLATIAAVTRDWKLMTGNATIVQHYPPLWKKGGRVPQEAQRDPLPPVQGAGVVLSGSCAERTLEQLADFEKSRPVLRMDLVKGGDVAESVASALEWALPKLADGPVAIATSASTEAVKQAQQRFGREGAAKLAEGILGGLSIALRDAGVRRFIVAGGETSGSIVEHLGIRSLRVGPYGGPGIGTATTDGPDPIAFCLKSGKLGPVDLFLKTFSSMQQSEGLQ